jgi:putative sugar O-methyltransferase
LKSGVSTDTPEFQSYLMVLDKVLRLRGSTTVNGSSKPSLYWREELDSFDFMLDASPLIVRKLRQHTHYVTGLRAYDYRTNQKRRKEQFIDKLVALKRQDKRGLLVPEARELGGFGYEFKGDLYNLDTLKFFEVLIGMEKGSILDSFSGKERQLVWEIGAGWGGFPYQFKTLFPKTTYVILDFPELFLFSAVYLKTLFPSALMRFEGDVPDNQLFHDWESLDFVFVSHTFLEKFQPPKIDLTVNMVSFQEMTSAQVDAYVQKAASLKSRFLYSLNRKKSKYNTEIEDVDSILAKYFVITPVEILPVSYNQMLPERKPKSFLRSVFRDRAPIEKDPYHHLVGRLNSRSL